MLTIRCEKCRTKLFKYLKIGQGNILYCYYDRIKKDYTETNENIVRCPQCGSVVGIREGARVKMKRSRFYHKGRKL